MIVLACCLLAIPGPLIIPNMIRKANRAHGNTKWPKATGVIVLAELVDAGPLGGDGKSKVRVYRSRLNYQYTVAGRQYVGHRYSYDLRSDAAVARSSPVGRSVDVYYDPRDPQNSVLRKGEMDAAAFWLTIGFGVVLSLGSWGAVALILWKSKFRFSPLGFLRRRGDPPVAEGNAATVAFPTINIKTVSSAVFSRAGITTMIVLGLLYVYQMIHLPPPVVRELRAQGNVVDFATEDSDIGNPPRPGKGAWRDSGIHDMQIFVVDDLEPLAKHAARMTNLKRLDLHETKVLNLWPLKDLKSLEQLDVRATRVSDLRPLAGLTNLQWLYLADTRTEDVSPLADLKELTLLDLANTPVRDVTPLSKLTELSSINLAHTQVRDLSPLTNCTSLRSFVLDEVQLRSNLAVLASLRKLIALDLRNADVTAAEVAELQDALPGCEIRQSVPETSEQPRLSPPGHR